MVTIDRIPWMQACAIAAICVLLAGCPAVTTQPTSLASSTSTPSGSSGSTGTPPTSSVTLSWTAPTLNTDGSILNDLAGYHIEYGTSTTAMNQTTDVTGATNTTYKIGNLSPGTYYFTVVAYSSAGTQSSPSPTVSKTI